jgi:DNA-binding GntR family transcriptional regulator
MACVYTGSDTTVDRREHAYRSLKARLVNGEFAAGERLREERLANELGVSRTPVREALARLVSDGLVARAADGYVPVVPDLLTIGELYEVRFALERWAISGPNRGGARHDLDAVDGLRRRWSNLDVEPGEPVDGSFVHLDEDFHVRLAASAGNATLADHLVAVNERIRVVRMHDFLTAERIERTIEQHLAVLDALLAGDVDTAEVKLVENFSESLAVAEERAALAIARMVDRWRR